MECSISFLECKGNSSSNIFISDIVKTLYIYSRNFCDLKLFEFLLLNLSRWKKVSYQHLSSAIHLQNKWMMKHTWWFKKLARKNSILSLVLIFREPNLRFINNLILSKKHIWLEIPHHNLEKLCHRACSKSKQVKNINNKLVFSPRTGCHFPTNYNVWDTWGLGKEATIK